MLKIVKGDITQITCDAIVNAANSTLLGGGGIDEAIHKAAGPKLFWECLKLGGCKVGHAKITKGYRLPCKYVIHTVGPKWRGGHRNEETLLKSCYRESIKLAIANQCRSIAIPLISSGIYGYPKDQVIKIAVDVISNEFAEIDIDVMLVIFNDDTMSLVRKMYTIDY